SLTMFLLQRTAMEWRGPPLATASQKISISRKAQSRLERKKATKWAMASKISRGQLPAVQVRMIHVRPPPSFFLEREVRSHRRRRPSGNEAGVRSLTSTDKHRWQLLLPGVSVHETRRGFAFTMNRTKVKLNSETLLPPCDTFCVRDN